MGLRELVIEEGSAMQLRLDLESAEWHFCSCMRTTIRQGIVMIERWLRLALAHLRGRPRTRYVELPLCRKGGGTIHGVELDDAAALLDRMEGRPGS